MKISDSFEHPTEDPGLELKVKVLKIALGKNKELLDTCQVLKEYMLFVERVRLHAKTMAGTGGGTPGCHRMHPGGDPFGFPLQKPSGGDRREYI